MEIALFYGVIWMSNAKSYKLQNAFSMLQIQNLRSWFRECIGFHAELDWLSSETFSGQE